MLSLYVYFFIVDGLTCTILCFVLVLGKTKTKTKLFLVLQWYFDLSKQKNVLVFVLTKPKQNRAGQSTVNSLTPLEPELSSPLGKRGLLLFALLLRHSSSLSSDALTMSLSRTIRPRPTAVLASRLLFINAQLRHRIQNTKRKCRRASGV